MRKIHRSLIVALGMVVVVADARTACRAGGIGKAVREALEFFGKRSGKLVREGVEEGVERSTGRMLRPVLKTGIESSAVQAARGAAKITPRVQALAIRLGDDVATKVVGKFGDDGVRALNVLSRHNAGRLAEISGDLVATGRGAEWMKLIAEHGDVAMDWIWQRRASVLIGAAATAIVLQPEEFFAATKDVATATIETAGERLLEPAIHEGAKHIAAPIAQAAADSFPWTSVWFTGLGSVVAWIGWRCWKSYRRA
jgi:hypothetical protein